MCVCVFRWRAGAGGEAALAVQRLPAGAERVPAAAAQTPQVPLHGHVTPPPSWTLRRTCAGRQGGREDSLRFPFIPAGWRADAEQAADATKTRRLSDQLVVGAIDVPDAVTPPPSALPTSSSSLSHPLEDWLGIVGVKDQFLKTSIQFKNTSRPATRQRLSGRRLDFYWLMQRRICGMNRGTKWLHLEEEMLDGYRSADQTSAPRAGLFPRFPLSLGDLTERCFWSCWI